MKNKILILLLFSLFVILACTNNDYNSHRYGIGIDVDVGYLEVLFYSPSIVRVIITPERQKHPDETLVVSAVPRRVKWTVDNLDDMIVIKTDSISLHIDKSVGEMVVYRRNGDFVTSNTPYKAGFKTIERDADHGYTVRHDFQLLDDEAIYGLGQYQDGIMNWRGEQVLLVQANTIAVVPFLVSTKGYGILWNQTSKSIFNDSEEGAWFWSEMADGVDFFLTVGNSIDDAIAGYREITGKAPLLPKWAYGFWQSKEHYRTQEEIIGVATEYRRLGIPLDVVVQDFMYWPSMEMWSGMVWDSTRFPDPKEMVETIQREYNTKVVAVIWPSVGVETELYSELKSINALYPKAHWAPARIYDAFNPLARDIYFEHANRGVLSTGIDGWWMDATEPEFRGTFDRYQTELTLKSNGACYLGSLTRYLNAYTLYTTANVSDMTRVERPDKRVVILTRSSFAGQQRYGAIVWSGDLYSSWGSLRNQIAAGLNYSMTGNPYWTSDIGGFTSAFRFPGGVNDPAFRELYVRWYQFGAFSPIFRSHGSNTPREIWQFGDPGSWEYEAIAHATRLRYRLLPYIYSVAGKVDANGYTMMRGLAMDFPDDRNVWNINDQFMFGPSLLVSPVTLPVKHLPENVFESIPMRNWRGPDGDNRALSQSFFIGTEYDSLIVQRPTEIVNHIWRGNLPYEIDGKPYRMEYTGFLRPDESGIHRFQCKFFGGVRLWIGDELIIDNSVTDRHLTEEFSIYLSADTDSPFHLEYIQPQADAARLTLEWLTPSWNRNVSSQDDAWSTYLPDGTDWIDFWTGKLYKGGQKVDVVRHINDMPLYVRAGSIIPMGPVIQYADEPYREPVELRIYPGRDAEFLLYEDEGDGYGYEEGVRSEIRFRWDDLNRTLSIYERKGNFPGMKDEREFSIVLVSEDTGLGIHHGDGKIIRYSGDFIQVMIDGR